MHTHAVTPRPPRRLGAACGLLLLAAPLIAQDSRPEGSSPRGSGYEHERQGLAHAAHGANAAHAGHADLHRVRPADAGVELIALETIERLESDATALCRAAELALTVGLLSELESERVAWFRRGEEYARLARRLRPHSPDPLFMMAAAVGLRAPHEPLRDRIRSADRVLELSREILEREPGHPGGLHLRGQLSATAMRLNPVVRFTVEKLMGSDVIRAASWKSAEEDFRRALAVEPDDPAHRIELSQLLRDTRRPEEARRELLRVLETEGSGALAEYYRERARGLLGGVR